MSRHSKTLDLILAPGFRMCVGEKDAILTTEADKNSDRYPVREIYVEKSTGKLVIVFDDLED